MKKFLIAGSSLAAVAAAGSAGAVDVTLGGSIDMGVKYGVGKAMGDKHFAIGDNYQTISISVAAAGTTDAGLKFGGSFSLSTADELVFNPYHPVPAGKAAATDGDPKYLYKKVNTDATAKLRGNAYNVSGGGKVSAGQMVSVKINSAWHAAATSVTAYNHTIVALDTKSAICKLAGEIEAGNGVVTRGAGNSEAIAAGIARAGQVKTGNATFTANINNTAPIKLIGNTVVQVDLVNGTGAIANITADKVFHGPFMEVKMTSSTTKMVVGGVCVTNQFDKTDTKIHMDVASRVMHVSDASIYIEGGFGKLSVGTGAYKGSVAGVGGAGDQVEIAGDLNATISSVSFLGFSGHGAVAVDSIDLGQRPNYAFGTSTNLLGLTVAVEMEDEQSTTDTNTWINKWDASTSYDLNGMSVAIATDSAGDWAMSLGYELMGFSASSVIQNIAPKKGKKSGLNIDTTLATSLNGVGISVALDEHLAWSIGASYSMGGSGLSIYANYSQADNGGKIGAKMSF